MEATDQAEKPKSFREVKAQELREKREARQAGYGSPPEESVTNRPALGDDVEDVVEDDSLDNASEMELETPADESELEEPAEDDGAEEDEAETLEARYERVEKERSELEKKLTEVTANRRQIEEDRAAEAESFVTMKHQLTDSLDQVRQGAEFYANIASQQLRQLQQVNPATLSGDEQSKYYQQLNMATQNAQQQQQALENFRKYEAQQKEMVKEREAEIARARLKSSIPGWGNELYTELGSIAEDFGYSREEFSNSTDYRLMMLLNAQREAKKAAEAVKQTVKQRNAKPPKSRSAQQQPRNTRGQFERAKKEFAPNKRGSFAAMKMAEMRHRNQSS